MEICFSRFLPVNISGFTGDLTSIRPLQCRRSKTHFQIPLTLFFVWIFVCLVSEWLNPAGPTWTNLYLKQVLYIFAVNFGILSKPIKNHINIIDHFSCLTFQGVQNAQSWLKNKIRRLYALKLYVQKVLTHFMYKFTIWNGSKWIKIKIANFLTLGNDSCHCLSMVIKAWKWSHALAHDASRDLRPYACSKHF